MKVYRVLDSVITLFLKKQELNEEETPHEEAEEALQVIIQAIKLGTVVVALLFRAKMKCAPPQDEILLGEMHQEDEEMVAAARKVTGTWKLERLISNGIKPTKRSPSSCLSGKLPLLI